MCPNNWWGYNVRCDVAHPYLSNRAQGSVGLVAQDQLNRREGEVTCFHWANLVSCKNVHMVSDGWSA